MRPLGIEKKEIDWDMVEKALKEREQNAKR